MCRASESNFEDLDLILPCCNRNSSLNKLEYSFLQGFVKFAIEIINYDKAKYSIENELIPELRARTEVLIIHKIWTRAQFDIKALQTPFSERLRRVRPS
jgi:hypothetical protein